jgi:hypothetical protein
VITTFGLFGLGLGASAAPTLSSVVAQPLDEPKQPFGVIEVKAVPGAIVWQNLRAASVLYAVARLEEMQLFAVADRVADAFASGKLAVGPGAKRLAQGYVKARPTRLGAEQRKTLYSHVFGEPGAGDATPNKDFAALWARLMEEVSPFLERQQPLADKKGKAGGPVSASEVHRAARDLAQNLSARTYGAPVAAAALLARQIRDIDALLSHPETAAVFRVQDAWEVVDKVARSELGRSANVVRARTAAQAGGDIIAWLGKVASPLAASGGAAQVAASLTSSRVPQSVRELGRVERPRQAALPEAKAYEVHALCFDAQRRLVACAVAAK